MNIFKMPVHAAAEVFPMIPIDELEELAEDIKVNGLIQPIIVKEGVLIDGRNRREACRIAGVEPEVQELNGSDPVAYILSSNINRRHMTKGQRAMAVAKVCLETRQTIREASKTSGLDKTRVGYANVVLKHTPDLADSVLNGSRSLDKAYELAREAKEAAEDDSEKLARLQSVAPDIATKVMEEDLSLEDGLEQYQQVEEEARRDRQGWWKILSDLETNQLVIDEKSIDEIVRNYRAYPKESGVDLESLSEWYLHVFQSILGKLNK